jgi:hypothetical protein
MWFLFSCNYINITCGIFFGFTYTSPFTLTPFSLFHVLFLILTNSCALGLSMETNGWKRRSIARRM